MKQLVIIPTYNEKENISSLINEIYKCSINVDVLVVDDNSPDGTGQIVEGIARNNSRVHLLSRSGKQGLAKAYLSGFKWGLEKDYSVLVEMDADFSHRPVDLVKILEAITRNDFVVGSRYVQGGGTVNWGIIRKIISRGGSLYSRIILGEKLNDWTGGFNAWTNKALKEIELDKIRSEGYSFQIEMKYRALKAGLKGVEVPIIFEDRRVGQSKMSMKIVIEAFYKVWGIRFSV